MLIIAGNVEKYNIVDKIPEDKAMKETDAKEEN